MKKEVSWLYKHCIGLKGNNQTLHPKLQPCVLGGRGGDGAFDCGLGEPLQGKRGFRV